MGTQRAAPWWSSPSFLDPRVFWAGVYYIAAMRKGRPFDVIVYGATGFTGRLVARYLAEKGETERWAIAGRNRDKLQAVHDELAAIDARWAGLPLIEASADNPESLHAMAAQTRVVLSTVGPFIRYGLPLVEACTAEGTSYCDITGEPEFVDQTLAFHDEAKAKGIKIISCCGFDSIPHDLGAWLCAQELPHDQPMTIKGFVRSRGTFSGGTWQSAIQAMANFRQHAAKRKARRKGRRSDASRKVRALPMRIFRESRLGAWGVPLPTIDPEIVRRSARALETYGPDFRYGHYAQVKKLPTVIGGTLAVGGIMALSQVPVTRRMLQQVKGSGEGPTEEERARSWFTATFLGEGGGQHAKVVVSGGDPGYDETAKMVAETALALALDDTGERAGVVTPAEGVGAPLVARLRAAGMKLEIANA